MRRAGKLMLLGTATTYARIDNLLRRALTAGQRAAGGLLAHALADDELPSLSSRLYSVSESRARNGEGLFSWESPWLESRLQPAPGRVLVTAAGTGREAEHLNKAGYAVDAFEPSSARVRLCRERLASDCRVAVASHEDWINAVTDGAGDELGGIATTTYDAILLGWGSLSHAIGQDEPSRIVRAADRCCPRGPILASFLPANGSRTAPSRAERLGRSVGLGLARMRGTEAASPSAVFTPWAGFVRSFSRDDIESLGAEVNRRVLWEGGEGATVHVTFVK